MDAGAASIFHALPNTPPPNLQHSINCRVLPQVLPIEAGAIQQCLHHLPLQEPQDDQKNPGKKKKKRKGKHNNKHKKKEKKKEKELEKEREKDEGRRRKAPSPRTEDTPFPGVPLHADAPFPGVPLRMESPRPLRASTISTVPRPSQMDTPSTQSPAPSLTPSPVFGVSLDDVMKFEKANVKDAEEHHKKHEVPAILVILANAILQLGGANKEGLFR